MTRLTPVLVRMTEAFTNVAVWARQHGDFLKALFTGLAVAATALGGAIAFALLGPLALFVPLVALAIGAGALLWDDWQHWLHTGRGAFGDFYEFVRDKWKETAGLRSARHRRLAARLEGPLARPQGRLGRRQGDVLRHQRRDPQCLEPFSART